MTNPLPMHLGVMVTKIQIGLFLWVKLRKSEQLWNGTGLLMIIYFPWVSAALWQKITP